MKTVVITGSSRGLGFELAKCFRNAGLNVVINGVNEEKLLNAKADLEALEGEGGVLAVKGSVTALSEVENIAATAEASFGNIDIWINNAGVNQPQKAIWELSESEIKAMFDTDLLGTVNGSKVAMLHMMKNHSGAIYNVEGYGSNDAMMLGLNIYGTTKRAVTHFTQALAKESEERGTGVLVGRLSPGIMITDFTVKALSGKESIELSEKTKKVYNILGDYPDVVAKFLTEKMLKNTKNNIQIQWLTTAKASLRFMTAGFNKRKFFD